MTANVRTQGLWTLLLLSLCVGCVEKAQTLTTAERKELERFVSKTPSTPEHKLDVVFDQGQIELVGYDLKATKLAPGRALAVTWHWKVNKPLGEGWGLFTHLADAEDVSRRNEDSTGQVRNRLPPSQWEAGSYIRDPQIIIVPKAWDSPKVTIYTGLWKGNQRMAIKKGPQDEENRVRALSLDVQLKEDSTPSLTAAAAKMTPKLDGKLSEQVWIDAPASEKFVNTLSGAEGSFEATVKAAWDEEFLYFAFDVKDDYLKSEFKKDDDHLWKADCVEIMVDPDGDGKNYFEMQVAPTGVSFDTRYDSRRVPQPYGHVDWNAKMARGVVLRGKVNDDKPDEGYTAEIGIPWKAFKAGDTPAERPDPTKTWRVNFYVMDSQKKGQRSVGWAPTNVGDFHVPNKFGRLYFAAGHVTVPVAKSAADGDEAKAKPDDQKAAARKTSAAAPKGAAGTKNNPAAKTAEKAGTNK